MLSFLAQFAAAIPNGCDKTFLGLKPWFHYLDIGDAPDCSINRFNIFPDGSFGSDVPLVLLAIVDDLLRIAGMIAVVFVITGAVKLITSDGQPEKVVRARETIVNALIGLGIALVAVAFVSFIGTRLTK